MARLPAFLTIIWVNNILSLKIHLEIREDSLIILAKLREYILDDNALISNLY